MVVVATRNVLSFTVWFQNVKYIFLGMLQGFKKNLLLMRRDARKTTAGSAPPSSKRIKTLDTKSESKTFLGFSVLFSQRLNETVVLTYETRNYSLG